MSDSEPIHETYLRELRTVAEKHCADTALQAAALTIEYILASSSRGFYRRPDLPFVLPGKAAPTNDGKG